MVNLIDQVYSKEKQELFTDREKELKIIETAVNGLKKGIRKHIALIGLRRIGKSMIIFEYIKRNKDIPVVHIDLKKASIEPQFLGEEYIRKVLQWILDDDEEDILVLANRLKDEFVFNQIKMFQNYVKEKNNLKIINFAFGFPELMSQRINKKIVVCIDEFQEILSINKYSGIDNIINLFRTALQSQSNTLYIISGSVITIMENICLQDNSALFLHFDNILNLCNFTKEDSFRLIKKIFKQERLNMPDEKVLFEIFRLSMGHAFYLTVISKKTIEMNKLFEFEINENLVRKAFLLELMDKNSRLYNYFNYIFENSLEKARGKASLKTILIKISKKGEKTALEISKELNKEYGETLTLLKRLIESDLLVKKEKNYQFRDPLLGAWVRLFYLGKDIDEHIKDKCAEDLFFQLQEKYLRVSSELGRAKEYEFKVKLEEKYGIKLENFQKGKIEFDLVGKRGRVWHAFEIKWKNSPAGYGDLKKFYENARKVFGKCELHFLSKSGFTDEARKFAEKNSMHMENEF